MFTFSPHYFFSVVLLSLFGMASISFVACSSKVLSPTKYLLEFHPKPGEELQQIVEISTEWQNPGQADTSSMTLSVVQNLGSSDSLIHFHVKAMKSLIQTANQEISMNSNSAKTGAEFQFKMRTQVSYDFKVDSKYKVLHSNVNVDSLVPQMDLLVGSLKIDSTKAELYRVKLKEQLKTEMLSNENTNVFGFYEGLFPDTSVGVGDSWVVLQNSQQSILKSVLTKYHVISVDSTSMVIEGEGVIPVSQENIVADSLLSLVTIDLNTGWVLNSDFTILIHEPKQMVRAKSKTLTTRYSHDELYK
mgnify:CR=1 FL=1